MVGVAAAGSGRPEIVIAGLAGLVAGAMSTGEYVSVSSQTDAEQADIARETHELKETPEAELEERSRIYVGRGLDADWSRARDELGISETVTAHPIQAALVSGKIGLTAFFGDSLPYVCKLKQTHRPPR